jgi:positive regulator of sigma E activity
MIFRSCQLLSASAEDVSVRVTRPSACTTCAKGQGCGLSVLGNRAVPGDPITLKIPGCENLLDSQSPVQVGISEARLLHLSSVAYCLPVVAMMLGAWILPALLGAVGNDWLSFAGALGGLGAAVLFLRYFDRCLQYRLNRGAGEVILQESESF